MKEFVAKNLAWLGRTEANTDAHRVGIAMPQIPNLAASLCNVSLVTVPRPVRGGDTFGQNV